MLKEEHGHDECCKAIEESSIWSGVILVKRTPFDFAIDKLLIPYPEGLKTKKENPIWVFL